MELDEFKIIMRANLQKLLIHQPEMMVENVIGKKSRSVVFHIRRNLWIEFLFAVLFLVLLSYIIFTSVNIYITIIGYLMACYCVAFIFYLSKLYKKISYHDATELSIKEYLEQLILILTAFTRLYFQLALLMLPVCFCSGLILSYLNRRNNIPDFEVAISLREFVLYFTAFIAWSVLMYYFSKLYIRKLYGNYLQKLRDQLTDLKNNQ